MIRKWKYYKNKTYLIKRMQLKILVFKMNLKFMHVKEALTMRARRLDRVWLKMKIIFQNQWVKQKMQQAIFLKKIF
jgi:hypothetical protein